MPHISDICDHTMGGTAISYWLRGDFMIVVQGSANVGFSGKRVVEQFQERKVARDFQHGSWLLHRGFVDECVAVDELAKRLVELLSHVADGRNLADLRTRRTRLWKPKETVSLNTNPRRSSTVVRQSSKECKDVMGDRRAKPGCRAPSPPGGTD